MLVNRRGARGRRCTPVQRCTHSAAPPHCASVWYRRGGGGGVQHNRSTKTLRRQRTCVSADDGAPPSTCRGLIAAPPLPQLHTKLQCSDDETFFGVRGAPSQRASRTPSIKTARREPRRVDSTGAPTIYAPPTMSMRAATARSPCVRVRGLRTRVTTSLKASNLKAGPAPRTPLWMRRASSKTLHLKPALTNARCL